MKLGYLYRRCGFATTSVLPVGICGALILLTYALCRGGYRKRLGLLFRAYMSSRVYREGESKEACPDRAKGEAHAP